MTESVARRLIKNVARVSLFLVFALLIVWRAMGDRGVRRWIRDRIRRFNKQILNPILLTVARYRQGSYPAVVLHVGRRSGHRYATPVVAVPIAGGFLIPLPYGTETDWCRNVRSAGAFTLEQEGVSYRVDRPELLNATVAYPLLDLAHRWVWRLFGITHYLRVHQRAVLSPGPVLNPR
ncbi:hypothetical protein [Nitrolancea hollandica]|uniref:Nitroreductase family deazaflavin-dependent oxidoreductase n=1 Tax=Nitrolancea hollandica Lb TaxID=1129897 RepID=I4EJG1_9BACT|nr:hypothetical protein [Nitrolancea hollandica]CCF84823.1 conserved hypothetical protein [Nitrolancea hollandica Lb]